MAEGLVGLRSCKEYQYWTEIYNAWKKRRRAYERYKAAYEEAHKEYHQENKPIQKKPKESNPVGHADIVARDLAYPVISIFGHIGLWDKKKKRVIEVLNEPKVVQRNSLENFKSRSKYWGARGGFDFVKNHPYRLNLSRYIAKTAWEQRKFKPNYTTSTKYTMGEVRGVTCLEFYGRQVPECGNPFDKNSPSWRGDTPNASKYGLKMIRGEFRCDSFVVFAYKQGAGVDIRPGGHGRNGRDNYAPRIIYNRMPKQR